MKMNPVIHFEMPAEDRDRVAGFYSKVFGWQFQMLGEEYGNYALAATTESDEQGPIQRCAINGGFYLKNGDSPAQAPHVVIAVDDIQDSMKQVKDAGGQVLGEPMDIPGVGKYVSFVDTEGNGVGMLQPDPQMNIPAS